MSRYDGFYGEDEFGGWGKAICSVICPEGGSAGEKATAACETMCPDRAEAAKSGAQMDASSDVAQQVAQSSASMAAAAQALLTGQVLDAQTDAMNASASASQVAPSSQQGTLQNITSKMRRNRSALRDAMPARESAGGMGPVLLLGGGVLAALVLAKVLKK